MLISLAARPWPDSAYQLEIISAYTLVNLMFYRTVQIMSYQGSYTNKNYRTLHCGSLVCRPGTSTAVPSVFS